MICLIKPVVAIGMICLYYRTFVPSLKRQRRVFFFSAKVLDMNDWRIKIQSTVEFSFCYPNWLSIIVLCFISENVKGVSISSSSMILSVFVSSSVESLKIMFERILRLLNIFSACPLIIVVNWLTVSLILWLSIVCVICDRRSLSSDRAILNGSLSELFHTMCMFGYE